MSEIDLLHEISDEELASLDCPTFEEQELEWQKIYKNLNDENITKLIESIDLIFIKSILNIQTNGVINMICFIEVKDLSENRSELVLRISNPHKFWKNRRCRNEVGFMKYLNQNTKIPVPKILSFSFNPQTSLIGCEYILMEKISGENLYDLVTKVEPSKLPENLINDMIDYVKILREIKLVNTLNGQIFCFNENMEPADIVLDGPAIERCDNYLEFIERLLSWEVKEINKLSKYRWLANELENVRKNLVEICAKNKRLNNLNFDDETTTFHGDLHCGNILADENFNITAILDWEFVTHGFDNVELDIFSKMNWCDEEEKSRQLQERVDLKKCELSWLKKSSGKEVRSYLFELTGAANQMGFYVSTWFRNSDNLRGAVVRQYINCNCENLPGICIRERIYNNAVELQKLLKISDFYLNVLRNY